MAVSQDNNAQWYIDFKKKLAKSEGAKGREKALEGGGSTRGFGITFVPPSLKEILLGRGLNAETMPDKDLFNELVDWHRDQVVDYFGEETYNKLPTSVKGAAIDLNYNLKGGVRTASEFTAAAKKGNYQETAKQLLDIVTANDPDTNQKGILAGFINRRIEHYNNIADQNAFRRITNFSVARSNQKGKKTLLTYETEAGTPIQFHLASPPHTRAKSLIDQINKVEISSPDDMMLVEPSVEQKTASQMSDSDARQRREQRIVESKQAEKAKEEQLDIIEEKILPQKVVEEEQQIDVIEERQLKPLLEDDPDTDIITERQVKQPEQIQGDLVKIIEDKQPVKTDETASEIGQDALSSKVAEMPEVDVDLRQKAIDKANEPIVKNFDKTLTAEQRVLKRLQERESILGLVQPRPFNTFTAPEEAFAKYDYEKELQAKRPTFKEAWNASRQEDRILSWAINDDPKQVPDPDFRVSTEDQARLTKDLPEEYHDFLDDGVNMNHLERLAERARVSFENEQKLSSLGWKGVATRFGVAFTDPAAWGISAFTEGVAAPAIWGNKISRLGRAVRGATGAAATNAAIEGYLVSQNSIKDPYDIMYAASLGAVMGGTIGMALGGNSTNAIYNRALVDIAKRADVEQQMDTRSAINREVLGEGHPDSLDTSVGAAENADSRPVQMGDLTTTLDDTLQMVGDVQAPAMAKGRLAESKFLHTDMAGFMLNSRLRIANWLGRTLFEDPVGFRADGTQVIDPSADILKTMKMKVYFQEYYGVYNEAFKAWAKSQGYGWLSRWANLPRRKFGELVADAIENPNAPYNENVAAAARNQSRIMTIIKNEAQAREVDGFQTIPDNPQYFTHLWNPHKFTETNVRYGQNSIVRMLAASLMRGTEDLNEEVAMQIAKGMNQKLRESHVGMDSGATRLFNADQKETLRDILVEEGFMDAEQADNLMGLFDLKPDGTPARAKRRLRFDMEHTETIQNRETGQMETVRIKDLQERDAEQVFSLYASQMAGRNALAEVGIKSEAMFNRMLRQMRAEADSLIDEKEISKLDDYELVAQTGFNMILGRRAPLASDPTSAYARGTRLVKSYNFIRLMNQTGFAQLGELGNAMSIAGVRAVIQEIPAFRAMLKRARDGTIPDPVLQDIAAATGHANDRFINQSINRADNLDVFSEGRGDWIDKGNFFIQPIQRGVADISGMAPITAGLEAITAKVVVNTLATMAHGGRKILSRERLAGLGLSENMAERVFALFRKHAVMADSWLFPNKKVKQTNFKAMQEDDIEAYEKLIVAITRWSRRAIQQNDVGNLNLYMTSEMGSIITQFRTFSIVSHSKQFLHNLKARDARAFFALMYSSMTAGMSYMAQQQINSIGREDKEEFLKERLSVSAVAKASFQRSSYAAMFPGLVDTGALFFTDDPIFAFRSSGLDTNLVSGIPTVQLLSKGLSTAQAASRSLLNPDLQWSQGHQRALNSLAPLQNAVGIRNVLNKLVEMQPKYSTME